MKKFPDKFKILIFILAGLVVFQAVSISVLWVKNVRLKKALAVKPARVALHRKILLPSARITGKVAIVLDDWGYNKKNVSALFSLGQPVTIAVLPNLPYSKTIALDAGKNNIEVILHLPLEAHDSKKRPEKDTIYTNMNENQALDRLQSALDSVPGLKGISNHQGSKATEDEKLMKLLLAQFKKRNLYFLDSLVTNNSVCQSLAAGIGIKYAERSVFLDNENDIEYIKGQLRELIETAKQGKSAVGIGHDRLLTLKAIKEMFPEFRREGVRLVYLSEVVR